MDGQVNTGEKVLVVRFHYDGVKLNLVKARLVFGSTPERRFKRDGLSFSLLDREGLLLSEFSIRDPRYLDYAEDPPGGELEKEADFTEVFPYSEDAGKIRVVDVVSANVVGEFDLSDYFAAFCGKYPNDPSCICEGNLDDDGDQDGSDNASFSLAFGSQDHNADINRDQQINYVI